MKREAPVTHSAAGQSSFENRNNHAVHVMEFAMRGEKSVGTSNRAVIAMSSNAKIARSNAQRNANRFGVESP